MSLPERLYLKARTRRPNEPTLQHLASLAQGVGAVALGLSPLVGTLLLLLGLSGARIGHLFRL
jgi:hypothetical protein